MPNQPWVALPGVILSDPTSVPGANPDAGGTGIDNGTDTGTTDEMEVVPVEVAVEEVKEDE